MNLPQGDVTFVFTDIEGSTRLLRGLGDDYREVLERHGEIIRSAVAQEGGHVVSTEGDSFFLVFTDPLAAVAAVADMQRQLTAESWPSPVAVRVGIHTGLGNQGGDNYWGIDVHRAARISSAGHGGQVLVSADTAARVAPRLPSTLRLKSLGSHRFKDLGASEEVLQLLIEGVREDFPPLATLEVSPHNLPIQLTTFVERSELAEIKELLRTARLVTLTGPGGTGKTRLSLQVAAEEIDHHRDGVWFVPLAAITDPDLVSTEVAATLSLSPGDRHPDERLIEHLRSKDLLLVLDNFEQVLGAGTNVAAWLRGAPNIRVLVTSRAPLRISGEHEYPVPTLGDQEAVDLFLQRARAVQPSLTLDVENRHLVDNIINRLDALPLAIELAAARLRVLSLESIEQRLESRLGLLTSGARDLPARQRTLRGAIEWSFDLLEPRYQELFTLLGVFVGGFGFDEAEQVVGQTVSYDLLEGLEALIEQSLLKPVFDSTNTRFFMLETIRELAAEKLVAHPNAAEIRARHAAAYLHVVETAAPHFVDDTQRKWLDRVAEDHDNIRAAITSTIEEKDAETAQRMTGGMWRFWQMRGFLSEGRHRTQAALDAGPGSLLSRLRALDGAGGLAYWQADGLATKHYYEQQVEVARRLGDKRELGYALYNLSSGVAVLGTGEAIPFIEEAIGLAEEIGDTVLLGSLYWGLGSTYYTLIGPSEQDENLEKAIAALERAAEYLVGSGNSFQIGWTDNMLAACLLVAHRPDEAIVHLRAGLRRFLDAGDLSALPLQVVSYAEYVLQKGNAELGVLLSGASRMIQQRSDTRLLDIAANDVRGAMEAIASLGPEHANELLSRGAALTEAEVLAIVSDL